MDNAPANPTAAVLLIGNELLSGKVDDENGRYLIRSLRALGVDLLELRVIPDDIGRIAEATAQVAERYSHVFTSGGVGPTHDDLTIAGIASAFSAPLVRNTGLAERIVAHFGDEPEKAEAWLKMAELPEGCSLLYLGDVWWPVLLMRNVYILPGIPETFRRQFDALKDRFRADRFVLRTLYLRSGEGDIAATLTRAAQDFAGVMIGSYPVLHVPEYRVRVTLEGKDRQQIDRAFRWLMTQLPRQDVYKVVDG